MNIAMNDFRNTAVEKKLESKNGFFSSFVLVRSGECVVTTVCVSLLKSPK